MYDAYEENFFLRKKKKEKKETPFTSALWDIVTHRLFHTPLILSLEHFSTKISPISRTTCRPESSLKEFPHRTTVRCNRIYDHLEIVQYFLLFYFMQQGSIVMKSLENSAKDKRENKELR